MGSTGVGRECRLGPRLALPGAAPSRVLPLSRAREDALLAEATAKKEVTRVAMDTRNDKRRFEAKSATWRAMRRNGGAAGVAGGGMAGGGMAGQPVVA